VKREVQRKRENEKNPERKNAGERREREAACAVRE